MSDLVERLRHQAEHDFGPDKAEHDDWKAADRIAQLEAEVARLRRDLHKIHREANGNRKDKAFRIAQIAAKALQETEGE